VLACGETRGIPSSQRDAIVRGLRNLVPCPVVCYPSAGPSASWGLVGAVERSFRSRPEGTVCDVRAPQRSIGRCSVFPCSKGKGTGGLAATSSSIGPYARPSEGKPLLKGKHEKQKRGKRLRGKASNLVAGQTVKRVKVGRKPL